MSWQAYVDSSLVGTGHIDKAAIFSVAGDSQWATSAGYQVSLDEAKFIGQIVSGSEDAKTKAFAEGVHIAGERYVAFKIEEDNLYLRSGKVGIHVTKTKQCFLIGHYPENVQAGNASQTVQALAEYLIKAGY